MPNSNAALLYAALLDSAAIMPRWIKWKSTMQAIRESMLAGRRLSLKHTRGGCDWGRGWGRYQLLSKRQEQHSLGLSRWVIQRAVAYCSILSFKWSKVKLFFFYPIFSIANSHLLAQSHAHASSETHEASCGKMILDCGLPLMQYHRKSNCTGRRVLTIVYCLYDLILASEWVVLLWLTRAALS